MKKLHGKVCVITGGASGIGRALGNELASRGASIVLADRQAEMAEEAAREIRGSGGNAVGVELDVRDAQAFEDVIAETVRRESRIDFLFNNAGIAVGGELEMYERADWDDVIDVNLRGVAYGIQAAYPYMIEQKYGHIVNTASVAGLIATAGEASYGASKHAVVGLTKVLRIEGKRHGVRASVLCPGAIRTPIFTGGRYGRMLFRGNVQDTDILALWEYMKPMAPPDFAKRAIKRVLANEAIIVVPAWWKLLWYLERLSPELSMRFSEYASGRLRTALEKAGATSEVRKPKRAAVRVDAPS